MGLATARLLAEQGAKVVCFDVSGRESEAAEGIGENAVAVNGDVSTAEAVQRAIAAAVDGFGRLDVLCNVAGIVPNPGGLTADFGEDDFDRVIAVNLRGTFLGMKYAIPAMIATGGGSIINWGSLASFIGTSHVVGYAASKGAVTQMTKTVAVEYATQGIRANGIAPGMVETPIMNAPHLQELAATLTARIPVGRFGRAEEAAQVAAFLASDASSYVSGVMIPVDGAYLAG
jgi:NAD(P)-dependent dehydrogenase (short-subunit alcohol dehydrogenase family)